MPAALISPARILRPAVRKSYLEQGPGARTEGRGAEPFVEVAWNEALDLVAAELKRVKTRYGNEGVFAGSYGWSSAGRFHHAQSQVHRFMNAIGGYVRHVTSYSLGAGRTLLPHVLRDIDALRARHTAWESLEKNCQLFVAFGGVPAKNVQVNSGGVSQHETRPGLRRLAAAGVAFVNVSPVRQDLGEVPGAEWLAIRPNTDTAVMLALAHVLVAENLHDREFLASHCVGFERFRPYLMGETDGVPKSPEWAGAIAGVEPGRLRALARRMAVSRTFVNASWSLQRADHGEQPFWMIVTLAAMLGKIGTPGGGLGIGYGSVNAEGSWAAPYSGPVLPQGTNAVKSFIPVARISDMLLNPGARFDYDGKSHVYPHIRLVYWCGGNPFHHHQDLNRLIEAWRRPDTIVVHDHYWTAAAKHADVVLPATTMLERDDIGSAGRDRHMIAMKKAVDAPGEARDDYAIFSDLARRLGVTSAYTENRNVADWLRHLYEASREKAALWDIELPDFEAFWRQGWFEARRPRDPQVCLDDFRTDPQAHPLSTPSGRIEIFSARIASFAYEDCPGHPVWQEPVEWLGAPSAERYPLHLISNQPSTKLHSQYDHGAVSLASKIHGREPIAMHPADAAARGLKPGEVVRVFNGRGACLAGLRVEDGLRPGVVEMATGAWYDPLEPGRIGTLDKHGNPNVLTLDKGSSKLGQGCIAHSCLVEVERYEGEPPPITAFDPPRFAARS
jgi:biotin/methionine sulfoxide reductase